MPRAELAKRYFDGDDGVIPEIMVNCYPQLLSRGGESGAVFKITHTPGLELITALASLGVCRGVWHDPSGPLDNTVAVFNSTAYYIGAGGTVDDSATLTNTAGGTAYVQFAASDTQLLIDAGTSAYITSSEVFNFGVVSDADFPTSRDDIAYLGGRFLVLSTDGKVYYSDLNDGFSWSATGFFEPETHPWNICVLDEVLYVFGSDEIELWGVTANPDAPYQRHVGANIPFGVLGDTTSFGTVVVQADDIIVFLGSDFRVYSLKGTQVTRVSEPWLEEELTAAASTALVTGGIRTTELETFVHAGVTWVSLAIRGAGTYWFNVGLKEWIARSTTGTLGVRAFAKSRGRGGSALSNIDGNPGFRTIVGTRVDNASAGLYALSDASFQELNGSGVMATITRQFSATLPLDRGSVPVDMLTLTCTPGRTTNTSTAPTIIMEPSRDGGRTYDTGLSRGFGVSADYDEQVAWQGLGSFGPPGFHARFTTSAEVALDVTACVLNEDPF